MALVSDTDSSRSRRMMAEALKRSPVLQNLSVDFIEELSHLATDRIFMPGDLIIEQGKKGDSMLIMVSGVAVVHVADHRTVSEPLPGDEEEHAARLKKLQQGKASMTKV